MRNRERQRGEENEGKDGYDKEEEEDENNGDKEEEEIGGNNNNDDKEEVENEGKDEGDL